MKLFYLLLLFVTAPVFAAQFQAPLTQTKWQVTESPLDCVLSQSIPDYGDARFSRHAGSASLLKLTFTTAYFPAKKAIARFEISEALWQNSEQRIQLASIPTQKGQRQFTLAGKGADQALTHLREGRFPTLRYPSTNSTEDIEVFFSTVHLFDVLPKFEQCLLNLHPDAFEDVQHLTVYFELEKAELTDKAKSSLRRLADYVRIDPAVKRIDVRGYTDNHGRKRLNIELSEARAKAVKNFLVKSCDIPESKITTSFHREFHPAKSNKTPKGRAYNRRAEIELFR